MPKLPVKVQRELEELRAFRDSIIHLRELHATPKGMEAHIQQTPELSKYVALCFANIVANSKNYTEMQFEPALRNGTTITVTVQKHEGKTPHQLRAQVEGIMRRLVVAGEAERRGILQEWKEYATSQGIQP